MPCLGWEGGGGLFYTHNSSMSTSTVGKKKLKKIVYPPSIPDRIIPRLFPLIEQLFKAVMPYILTGSRQKGHLEEYMASGYILPSGPPHTLGH
jgi:hypothetical protein